MAARPASAELPLAQTPVQRLAAQALSRAAGAPLIAGNDIELMIDARAHFDAWLAAIRGAQHGVLLENYIVRDDPIGRAFRDALAERAAAGVRVCVVVDWLGCLGLSNSRFWQPLRDAGGEVRVYNPPHFYGPAAWLSRNHRKQLVIDGELGFLSGVCLSEKWLGDPKQDIPPWRDTGVALRGPAVGEMVQAFADVWAGLGDPLPRTCRRIATDPAGAVDVRIIATQPSTAGLFRVDQLVAALARRSLWIADAYFVGLPPYVQALASAARDGVDVRLLVPGASDVPAVAALSRGGYRPLLEAGVRVFEWNGSMMHAKTAVADGRWARVGSSNLNIASWIGNCELDVGVENEEFARCMEAQYVRDLENCTEIVLAGRRRVRTERVPPPNPRRAGGSAGRAAAGALRMAHTVGAALGNVRVLGPAESGTLPWAGMILLALAGAGFVWPWLLAWPIAVLLTWVGAAVFARYLRARHTRPAAKAQVPAPVPVTPATIAEPAAAAPEPDAVPPCVAVVPPPDAVRQHTPA